MIPKSRFFQARFSTALPRSAVLAIALFVQASPARAETLALVCESDTGGSEEFLIDFDQKTVQRLPVSSCTWDFDGRELVVPGCYPPGRAEVTERSIAWETIKKTVSGTGVIGTNTISGSFNRVTGSVYLEEFGPSGNSWGAFRGKCRRATQKF